MTPATPLRNSVQTIDPDIEQVILARLETIEQDKKSAILWDAVFRRVTAAKLVP